MTYIPYGRQDISKEDLQSVVKVLESDWLTQGPNIEEFEQAVADYCGAKYAVAVNSATSALHIACMAASVGPGDWLWTTPNTFVASANCGRYCGADVDFVDIDRQTYNLSTAALEAKLQAEKLTGNLPKVVIPVDFSGQSCDMEAIAALAKQYNFTIIEDASHAIGGSYKGAKIGSCQYSDMTIFSFHPVKIVTTCEGGMVMTNRRDLYDKLIRLRSHGITRDPEMMNDEAHGPWYYQQVELGYNYRITDVQAALGISQMKRIDTFVDRRSAIARRYTEELAGLPLILPCQNESVKSAWHLYVIQVDDNICKKNRKQIFEELRAKGIGVNVHYIPVHTQPYYKNRGFGYGDFPISEQYYERAISIPVYYKLTDEEQSYIIRSLYEVVR